MLPALFITVHWGTSLTTPTRDSEHRALNQRLSKHTHFYPLCIQGGNTGYHWPWYTTGHMRGVLVMIQAQCERRHRPLLTVRLWHPSVSGHDRLTEGNQWSETWFGVKRRGLGQDTAYVHSMCVYVHARVCVCVGACTTAYGVYVHPSES